MSFSVKCWPFVRHPQHLHHHYHHHYHTGRRIWKHLIRPALVWTCVVTSGAGAALGPTWLMSPSSRTETQPTHRGRTHYYPPEWGVSQNTPAQIPEPSSLKLLAITIAIALIWLKRKS